MEVIDLTHRSEGNPQVQTDTENQNKGKKINTLKQERGGKTLLYNKVLTTKYGENNGIWTQYFAIYIVIIDLGKKLKPPGCKFVKANPSYFSPDYLIIIKGERYISDGEDW